MEAGDRDTGRDSLFARALSSEWIAPGFFFIALGLAAMWVSRNYPLGDLNRMGPGYFPRMLSIGMVVLGGLIVLRGVRDLRGTRGLRLQFDRSMLLIPLAMLFFGFTVERIGLVAALAVTIVIAGYAHRQASLKEILAWTVGLIVLLVLIFVVILKLPLRLWPGA